MNTKAKAGSRRNTLIAISLILVVVLLASSLVVYKFLMVDDDSVRVKNANELRDAINKAEVGVHTDIVLINDISLGPALSIPAGADITLTSTDRTGFFRLIGLNGVNVITVENGGRLTLDGIIVTHEAGSTGNGVVVEIGGTLIMVDGKISGNTATINDDEGGGVSVSWGYFTMSGGSITGNTARMGGGVFVGGDFKMIGGVISDNTASEYGGGVHVTRQSSFSMSDGVISDNTAISGGGVCVWVGTFDMFDGEVSNNKALSGYGGGVYNYYGTFNKSGGEISDNAAAVGNDVHQKLSE